jgi:pilus assembly protein CpaD
MVSLSKTALLASIAVTLAIGGCAKPTGTAALSEPSSDYRERHPIVIDTVPKNVSIYPLRGPGGLDRRQAEDIRAFAADYRATGSGHVMLMMPSNGGKLQHQTLSYARKELIAAGIPATHLRNGHYDPINPTNASPVKLEFQGVSAKLASECGKWDRDILDGGTQDGMENRPFDNFGCSTQAILAAQVEDPADLVRPRVMGDAQISKRIQDVTDVGNGTDPSTQWSVQVESTTGE